MDVIVNVINQKLKIASNLKNFVEGSENFIRFVFKLSSDWDGLSKYAQFIQKGIAYDRTLDDENSVYLPKQIKAGTCYMLLSGKGGGKIATTNYVVLTLDEDILVVDDDITDY